MCIGRKAYQSACAPVNRFAILRLVKPTFKKGQKPTFGKRGKAAGPNAGKKPSRLRRGKY
jgi:hypothetical protein